MECFRKKLTILPQKIFEFNNIKELSLQYNNIIAYPIKINHFKKLKKLEIDSDLLNELIIHISNFKKLKTLICYEKETHKFLPKKLRKLSLTFKKNKIENFAYIIKTNDQEIFQIINLIP